MSTLIVGASGFLGSVVARQATATGHAVVGTSTTGSGVWVPVDVTDRKSVRALISAVRPKLVINSTRGNWRVSADGAATVAAEAVAVGARLVHVSTDALHAGRPAPYTEDDTPTPVSLYGAAKAAAETAVAAIDPSAVIVRTSLIFGGGSSHETLVLDLLNGRSSGMLFTDEIRCPIHVEDLAAALLELADSRFSGILNVAGPDAVSRADFGRMIARARGLDDSKLPVGLSRDGGLGPRPLDVRLDTSLARTILRTRLRPLAETVSAPA
ncbi:SDR family oxidoreductase [Paractinoplanes brasiliensis]|uniref:dTDP-4-dehydrorhamnose reductase n=1 Tax=Paractinoplanes brasiliensis TaxID=52695 RepID=A0A4R6K0M2_9ACTN|nr:sugar nucleotide-binding protein [Actinoplanes brasiliensis]TDO41591.1 dTDP-4-dehydrorhamnose reductase [Actinoplanes brasiliensis]GID27122.1 dTDP-4-dehydrorhamnose reductase [Actinoplanes brasiliensis]